MANLHADMPAMIYIFVARPAATASPTWPPNADPLPDPMALPINATKRLMRTPRFVSSACSFETWGMYSLVARTEILSAPIVASIRFAIARRPVLNIPFDVSYQRLGELLQNAHIALDSLGYYIKGYFEINREVQIELLANKDD